MFFVVGLGWFGGWVVSGGLWFWCFVVLRFGVGLGFVCCELVLVVILECCVGCVVLALRFAGCLVGLFWVDLGGRFWVCLRCVGFGGF